jgi:outer membrane murein-binding lipoprotein Lpp
MYMKAIIMGMAAMGLLLFAGCATSTQEDNVSSAAGDGPAALVNQWVAALQAEDVNAVMTHFSDRYNNPRPAGGHLGDGSLARWRRGYRRAGAIARRLWTIQRKPETGGRSRSVEDCGNGRT